MCSMSFYLSLSTHHYSTTSGFVSIAYPAYTIYISTCREIRCFYILHKPFNINIIIVNVSNTCIDYFRKIMSRHIGCHTYCNTGCSIYQQVRNPCRHDSRFLQRVIKIILKINSFLIKILHHLFTYFL